ncbi:inositol monophosphatase [Patescibacteria group bacterium]|nr:inositol monophosphatase [Patescibacteria group bacterium]MBU1673693.1 inositol monophosphatase [Patescibacteria group bacterium]MBU1963078.1 inositol monophosphatase [Patescibacteria group bacterium]
MLKTAIKAAEAGGKVIMSYFHTSEANDLGTKKNSIVTRADLESEKAVLDILMKKFPHHSIYSEEAGFIERHSDFIWYVDPLDGTTNFSRGNPFFSISIALYEKDQPLMGVVFAPYMEEMFIAEKGEGAWLNGKRLKVSSRKEAKNMDVVMCEGNLRTLKRASKIFQKLGPKSADIRKLGSAALECAWVASGRADVYITTQINPYDVCAGILLIQEAGGKITDFKGQPWPMKTADMIGSNGKIHDQIVKFIKNL